MKIRRIAGALGAEILGIDLSMTIQLSYGCRSSVAGVQEVLRPFASRFFTQLQ